MNKYDDFDKFLIERFQNAKYNIKDNGFSEKVISSLPKYKNYPVKKNIVLFIAGILSIIVFIVSGGFKPMISSAIEIFNKSSQFLIPSVKSLIIIISFALIIVITSGLRYNRSTF